jgi:ribosomal protein S18 acetylase RimI-like enzyme
MKLESATINSIPQLMEVITQFYEHFSYPFEKEKHQKVVSFFLSNDYLGSIWLIKVEQEVVGYLALTYGFTFEFGGRDAFIDEFFIIEKYRNKGLGKKILLSIQEKMEELGLCALHLQTESHNENAKKLYQNLGFIDFKRNSLTFLKNE